MKKLTWFTHTNIDTRSIRKGISIANPTNDNPTVSINLTEFIPIFIKNCIWERKKYRTEYSDGYDKECLEKIKSVIINLHSQQAPYSNQHNYENVLNSYLDLGKFELSKIAVSSISEAMQIAVIEVEFNSENKVIDYLNYEEEKDIELIFDKRLTDENNTSWLELKKIKSIVCEFIQFYVFNLHLNFPTTKHEFSFTDKPNLIGFTTVTEGDNFYYETDKIDLLAHYILYQVETDNLLSLMQKTSKFWHKEIPSIHFFLDSLKGTHVTSTTFIKVVFTIESFFGKSTSNDFITLAIPLLLGKDINSMKSFRETLKSAFEKRNDIVHGNEIYHIREQINNKPESKSLGKLFIELKNIVIQLFYFYINENLFIGKNNEKINHELFFKYLPYGISANKTNSSRSKQNKN